MVPCYGQRIMVAPAGQCQRTKRGASRSTSPSCWRRYGRWEGWLLPESRNGELSHFSTAAQSELFYTDSEYDPAQIEKVPGAFKPPAPQRPYTCVQDPARPSWVFSISGSHLVRLVPQFESGQNCSDGLHRLGAVSMRGLNGGQYGSVRPIPKR